MRIQIPAQKPAMGHAMKSKMINHKIAKIGFLAMVEIRKRLFVKQQKG
jgi:hypothetical protein